MTNENAEKGKVPSGRVVELVQESLMDFYSRKENVDQILPIIKRNSQVSLRLLDFFVVHFSRYNNVIYRRDDNVVDVYRSYKTQLRTYSKKLFDPFRRGADERFDWYFSPNERHETTLGQLCFLKWAIGLGIIEYIEANLGKLAHAMKEHLSRDAEPVAASEAFRKRKASRRRASGIPAKATRQRATVGDCWVVEL